jgi:peptidoglycan L-alanyl-D-glutamate endopeptidase CwlK
LMLLWLLGFPDAREALARRIARRWHRLGDQLARWRRRSGTALSQSSRAALGNTGHWRRQFRQHRQIMLVLILLLALPALLVMSLRGRVMLDGYNASDNDDQGNASLVTALLKGEQLVPPPPLPPEAFTTREVEMIRPDLVGADRKWDKLNADFNQRLLAVYKIMKERYGYDMALLEGYRSPERQAELAAKGSSVTNAGAYQSYHQYGLAADSAFYRDGTLVISEKDPWAMQGYKLYGQVAEAAGLTWGGRWKMMDFGHVELHKAGVGPHAN